MLGLRLSMTDEGVWIARLCNKQPGYVGLMARHATIGVWPAQTEAGLWIDDVMYDTRQAMDWIIV